MQLIRNGNFDSGELAPWIVCTDPLNGGVVDRPIACPGTYNLQLRGNDCVRQTLSHEAVATDNLTLWVRFYTTFVEFMDSTTVGTLIVAVFYSDGTLSENSLNFDALMLAGSDRLLDPRRMTVAIDRGKPVRSVYISTRGTADSWYIGGVSLNGNYTFAPPPYMQASVQIADRLAGLEDQIDNLNRFICNERYPSKQQKQANVPAQKIIQKETEDYT